MTAGTPARGRRDAFASIAVLAVVVLGSPSIAAAQAPSPSPASAGPVDVGSFALPTDSDLAAEHDARKLYQEAASYCREVGDYPSEDLFKELMADEEGHIDFLEEQLDLISKLGVELYSQHHIGELGGSD